MPDIWLQSTNCPAFYFSDQKYCYLFYEIIYPRTNNLQRKCQVLNNGSHKVSLG